MVKFGRLAFVAGCVLGSGTIMHSADAATYTSSSAFGAATAGDSLIVENYSTGTAGQLISNGGSLDGLTYSVTGLGQFGTVNGSIITDHANSFSGLSLGGNQSTGDQFFYAGDSLTVTFSAPVTAVGVYLNVNLNSGNFEADSTAGNAITGSSSFDTDTFVFLGITSSTPFSDITLVSDNIEIGSYNIPEIEYLTATPLPAAFPLFAGGLGMVGLIAGRKKRKAAATATV